MVLHKVPVPYYSDCKESFVEWEHSFAVNEKARKAIKQETHCQKTLQDRDRDGRSTQIRQPQCWHTKLGVKNLMHLFCFTEVQVTKKYSCVYCTTTLLIDTSRIGVISKRQSVNAGGESSDVNILSVSFNTMWVFHPSVWFNETIEAVWTTHSMHSTFSIPACDPHLSSLNILTWLWSCCQSVITC